MRKNIAAFFDIDGTIYREGLITEVFKKMVTHEIIGREKWTDDVETAFKAWDRRVGDYDTYLTRMVSIYMEAIKGISKEHIEHIARKVIEQKGDRVYQFTRGEIERHLSEGHKVIAISGSPDALVKLMAEKYGFSDWRGTVYVTDENGCYTGEVIPMWDSDSKQKSILEFTELYDLDLKECYSYGDTNGDFTMLSMVGHPHAINPTKELITNLKNDSALKERVKIIVERKDVIYDLDIDEIHCVK